MTITANAVIVRLCVSRGPVHSLGTRFDYNPSSYSRRLHTLVDRISRSPARAPAGGMTCPTPLALSSTLYEYRSAGFRFLLDSQLSRHPEFTPRPRGRDHRHQR